MNSIVQESSSIAKAVQAAWIKAGKPQKFSVRIFEEAEKNFFGITSKPAKIALLFEKKDVTQHTSDVIQYTPEKPAIRKEATRRIITKPKEQVERAPKPSPQKEQRTTQERKVKVLWNDEMIAIARNWMKDVLIQLNKTDITFTTEVKRYHLRFLLSSPLATDENTQKSLFRNFAHLIMQSVRNRLKKQLLYHKIVLTSDTQ